MAPQAGLPGKQQYFLCISWMTQERLNNVKKSKAKRSVPQLPSQPPHGPSSSHPSQSGSPVLNGASNDPTRLQPETPRPPNLPGTSTQLNSDTQASELRLPPSRDSANRHDEGLWLANRLFDPSSSESRLVLANDPTQSCVILTITRFTEDPMV